MKVLLKKLIPLTIRSLIKKIKIILAIYIASIMSTWKITSSLYYVLFSREFSREHYSVLKGKIIHLNDLRKKSSNEYLLRRNIHRLEKGLLMRPMRKVFATDYISKTVNCYKALIDDIKFGRAKNTAEVKWAHDVLKEYFSVTGTHPIIDSMRDIFQSIDFIPNVTIKKDLIPYKRVETPSNLPTFDQLIELAKFRRSVRWFLPKQVPRELVDKALTIAALSPSACNRQPYHFRIFDEPDKVKLLSEIPMGTRGYNQNIPAMAALVGKLSAYPYERDRHLIYIDSALSAMSFVYALECQGLSSCIINWPDIESKEQQINKFLNLDVDERVVMLIAFGYPDPEGKVAYSQKRDLNEVRSYN